jgi:sucrose-phosphate synthase
MTPPILLVNELDEQLLGNPSSLDRFHTWLVKRRAGFRLVYLTRGFTSWVRQMVGVSRLPAPDFVVTSAGTEVDCFWDSRPVDGWKSRMPAAWSSTTVREVLADFPELKLQPEATPSPHKVSYLLERSSPRSLLSIEVALSEAGMDCDLSYARSHSLHILPRGINQVAAVRFLALKNSIPRSHIIVSGTSRADLDLYQEGYRGVVAASAERTLRERVAAPVYLSDRSHSDGLLEGIQYWATQLDGYNETSFSPFVATPCIQTLSESENVALPGMQRGEYRSRLPALAGIRRCIVYP